MSLNKLIKSFTNKSIGDFKTLLYDLGTLNDTIIVAGMGRSGTTWGVNIINHDNSYRVLFEPFSPASVVEAEEFEYVQYIRFPHIFTYIYYMCLICYKILI